MTRSSTILRLSDNRLKRLTGDGIDKTVGSDEKSSIQKLNRILETSFGLRVRADKNIEKRKNKQSNVKKRFMAKIVENKKRSQ